MTSRPSASDLLAKWGLSKYESMFKDADYLPDDVNDWVDVTLEDLCNDVGITNKMHARKFIKNAKEELPLPDAVSVQQMFSGIEHTFRRVFSKDNQNKTPLLLSSFLLQFVDIMQLLACYVNAHPNVSSVSLRKIVLYDGLTEAKTKSESDTGEGAVNLVSFLSDVRKVIGGAEFLVKCGWTKKTGNSNSNSNSKVDYEFDISAVGAVGVFELYSYLYSLLDNVMVKGEDQKQDTNETYEVLSQYEEVSKFPSIYRSFFKKIVESRGSSGNSNSNSNSNIAKDDSIVSMMEKCYEIFQHLNQECSKTPNSHILVKGLADISTMMQNAVTISRSDAMYSNLMRITGVDRLLELCGWKVQRQSSDACYKLDHELSKEYLDSLQKFVVFYSQTIVREKNVIDFKTKFEKTKYLQISAVKRNTDMSYAFRFPSGWHSRETKNIVFIGRTGTGKTTTINCLMNYIFGAQFGQEFLYKLIDEAKDKNVSTTSTDSQTNDVNVYYLAEAYLKLKYNLIIVDTPGFGDTRGAKVIERNTQKIEDLFSFTLDKCDMICIFLKASQTKLGAVEEALINNMLSLFGKDIRDNIYIIFTFAERYGDPNALACVKKIPRNEIYFAVNNSPIIRMVSGNKENADEAYMKGEWKFAMAKYEKIISVLTNSRPKSLAMAKKTIAQRRKINGYVKYLPVKIAKLLYMLALKSGELKTSKTLDITEKVEVPVHTFKHAKGSSTTKNLLCNSCEETCHVGCVRDHSWWTSLWCPAEPFWGSSCLRCSKKCSTKNHQLTYQDWKLRTVTEYEYRKRDAIYTASVQREVDDIELTIYYMFKDICDCTNELAKISLLPTAPRTIQNCVANYITQENSKREDGYRQRIQGIQSLLTGQKCAQLAQRKLPGYASFAEKNGGTSAGSSLWNKVQMYLK